MTTLKGIDNLKLIFLGILIMIIILEQIRQTGIILPSFKPGWHTAQMALLCFLTTLHMTMGSFIIKKYCPFNLIIIILNISSHFTINHYLITKITDFTVRIICVSFFIMILLKIISYHIEKEIATFKDFIYFIIIPALVFKNKYKKKTRFSIIRLLCLAFKFVLCWMVFICIMEIFIINYLKILDKTTNIFYLIETYLRFALWINISWFIVFYMLFDVYFEILKNITGYNEDVSYLDWWNANSISDFWRKWNIPFHKFAKLYILDSCANKKMGTILCFAFSGILHEYGVAVAANKATGYVFLAMLSQSIGRGIRGNFLFWVVFCFIGQPITVLFIYKSI